MVSDVEFYRVEGMTPKQVMATIDQEVEQGGDIVFSCDLENGGKQYDCNWTGGCYVEVRMDSEKPITLDGSEDLLVDALNRLEYILGSELVEVNE